MFRCTTQETACTVREIYRRMDSSSLTLCEEHAPCLYETEVGTVCLETEHPVMVEPFAEVPALGRFVLERAGHIVAGGVTAC